MTKLRLYAAVVILPLIMAAWITYLLSYNPNAVYNSDTAHLFLLAEELVFAPRYFLSWYLPGSNFIFPDVILATAVAATQVAPLWLPIAIGAVQSSILAWATASLLSSCGRYAPDRGVWVSAALFVVLTMLSLADPLAIGASMTLVLATPYMRVGTTICGVLIIAALTATINTPKSPLFAGALLVAALSGYSDPFFLLWFALPSCAAAVIISRRGGDRRLWRGAAGVVAAASLGIVIDKLTRSSPPEVPRMFQFSIRKGLKVFYEVLAAGDIFTVTAFVLIAIMAARAIHLLARKEFRAVNIAEILLAACCLSAILAPVLTGISWSPAHLRYSLPIFLFPAIWLLIVAPRLPVAAAMIVLILSACYTLFFLDRSRLRLEEPAQLAACLQNLGLRDGYSDYWNSKETVFLSGRKLHIAQLFDNGKPRLINMSRRWFSERSDGSPFKPDFILTQRLDSQLITQRFGPPARIANCGDNEVWIYPELPLANGALDGFR